MTRPRSDRGFALLIVLWTLVLLALVVTQLTSAGHGEAQLATNLRTGAGVEAQAEGAVYTAVFHLLDTSSGHWEADNQPREIRLPHAVAEIRVQNLDGRINPNTATPDLIAALLLEIGVNSRSAAALATAMIEWRTPGEEGQGDARLAQYRAAGLAYAPPGTPFQSLDELGYVVGMTPDLLRALRPHLSIFTIGDPDQAAADVAVARALQATNAAADSTFTQNDRRDNVVALITASVVAAGGARASRRAVVRIGEIINGRRWRILAWESPDV